MKILVIIPRFVPDRVAGAELEAKWLSEQFADKGHEVVILTKKSSKKPKVEIKGNLKVIRDITNPRTANPLPYLKVIEYWLKEKPDLIHIHHVYPTGLWTYPIAKFSNTPVFATTHAEIKGKDSDYDNIRSNFFKDHLCRAAARNLEKLILCSSNLEKEAEEMGLDGKNYKTINNCITQKSQEISREEYQRIQEKNGIEKEKKIVFLVSRIAEKKRYRRPY